MTWHDAISLVISVLSLCGFGVIMKHFWDDRHAKKLADTEAEKQRRKAERQNELKEIIQAELQPLKDDSDKILTQLQKNTTGTITLLRDQMKQILDACVKRGWASDSDKANYEELYNTYSDLGGNHFKEYVDQWHDTMKNLPKEIDYKNNKKTVKRKIKTVIQKSNEVSSTDNKTA